MFYQILLSPQVKRWAIITYNHGIYKLPHELPNDLRLSLVPSPPIKMKVSFILAENSWKTEMKVFLRCVISHGN